MTALTPKYLDVDFATLKQRFMDLLEADATFQDYNIEGANIAILMELVAYHSALTTYFSNQIAKNIQMDTTDVYECAHMNARLRGYNPMGYRSSSATVVASISSSAGVSNGDELYIPAWVVLKTTDVTDTDGNPIYFATVDSTTSTVSLSAGAHTVSLTVRQGEVVPYSYTGGDVVDNKLYLPFYNFDYDDDLYDQSPSIQVQINDDIWERVPEFYDEISGLEGVTDNVYMFRYDKYKKYVVEFSSSRNVPISTDSITVTVLKTLGSDGNVGATFIDTIDSTLFIENRTTGSYLDNTYITVSNPTAAIGGSVPETIDEIRESSTSAIHSQYRCVTKNDYIGYLETRSDVVVANVWGEQEVAPSGSTLLYNKVFLSLIPDEWGSGTISTSASPTSAGVFEATSYATDWKTDVSTYLEPQKMLCAYEEYVLPDLVFFTFNIGLKIKRTYNYDTVKQAVKDKLEYYFSSINRSFKETISFTDIQEYILDTENVSSTDNFEAVKGIQTLIIRDIDVITHTVYEPNSIGNYPQYETTSSTYTGDNKLRYIELGNNQFPMIYIEGCVFGEET